MARPFPYDRQKRAVILAADVLSRYARSMTRKPVTMQCITHERIGSRLFAVIEASDPAGFTITESIIIMPRGGWHTKARIPRWKKV